jgi:hypothetical protein
MKEEEDDLIFENMEFEQADTRYEIISMCNQALSSVEGFDTYMIDEKDTYKIKEIKRKCLALIDLHIGMIYDENFES